MIVPRYYENLSVLHENTMPVRAYYIPASKRMDNLVEHREESDRMQLLNGAWKFQYFNSIYDIQDSFFEKNYDTENHMDKGDIGFVFPDVIHHYQVLTPGVNKATYLIASPFTIAKFADIMQSRAPEYPIIKAENVEPEVYRVINAILETEPSDITVAQAYLQIVLARCIGKLNLVEKSNVGSNDLIYQTVSYISANFKKKFSLEEMAKDLGVSKYVLSRLFYKTFHRNFNQYLNDARLNYACHRLENTSDPITNICLDSGFESQRTFNRVFKERYKISPSDYRNTCVKEMLS